MKIDARRTVFLRPPPNLPQKISQRQIEINTVPKDAEAVADNVSYSSAKSTSTGPYQGVARSRLSGMFPRHEILRGN